MELIVLRHGEAGNSSPSMTKDFGRGLTTSGRDEMEEVAVSIYGMKLEIDRIMTSPLPRARESAEIVAKRLKKQEVLEVWDELKPEGRTADLYRRLSKLKGESSVLLVGHEPFLSCMIGELITGGRSCGIVLKKAGMAKVFVRSFGSKPSGELRWLMTPRQLRRMT
ncbi:MAG TPA: phosphohistidine phosphatase SixA, partial [Nitrososphaerales archaeon]|nr:phosphohistidine phosphatase SixA [Nitrososphaerales archaeon]